MDLCYRLPTALGKGCVPLEEFYSGLDHIYLSGGEQLRALKPPASWGSMFYLDAKTTQVEKLKKIQFRQTGCNFLHRHSTTAATASLWNQR